MCSSTVSLQATAFRWSKHRSARVPQHPVYKHLSICPILSFTRSCLFISKLTSKQRKIEKHTKETDSQSQAGETVSQRWAQRSQQKLTINCPVSQQWAQQSQQKPTINCPVSQQWAQQSQQKPTINCPVSPRWLCCQQWRQQKSLCWVLKIDVLFMFVHRRWRNRCLSSSYSASFSAEYKKSLRKKWMAPWWPIIGTHWMHQQDQEWCKITAIK